MKFYTDLFTPETWQAFQEHGCNISGFKERQQRSVHGIEIGDILVCYIVRLSRWAGLLRVDSKPFTDTVPIFADPDPYTLRFNVNPVVLLELERSIPIFEDEIWFGLSITKKLEKRSFGWAQSANLRTSLRPLRNEDGQLLYDLLTRQKEMPKTYPLSDEDKRRLNQRSSLQTVDRSVFVDIPEEDEQPVEDEKTEPSLVASVRESRRIQAAIAKMGAQMGFHVWIAPTDRHRVSDLIEPEFHAAFLNKLPLNYNDVTLRIIEQISRSGAMARAFEVEHTTAIFSGLLRMADLLALQPNMNIRLHIVAPLDKRDKVLREIARPVFSLLGQGPLYEKCSYIDYGSIDGMAALPHLNYMRDAVLEEYEEYSEER